MLARLFVTEGGNMLDLWYFLDFMNDVRPGLERVGGIHNELMEFELDLNIKGILVMCFSKSIL